MDYIKSELIVKRCHRPFSVLLATLVFFVAASYAQEKSDLLSDIKFYSDFRLRYENTTNRDNMDARNREVVRFRAGLTKKISELFNFGARLATGSSDDPNTADVTLGNFVNDLEISLDRLYLELNHQHFFLTGGKFGNPFLRTDLVWDGDVNPQGVAGSYTSSGSKKVISKLTSIYSIIDEQSIAPDSYMVGGQIEFSIHPAPDLSLTLAGAYYDYTIRSLRNADAGDTRSNYLTPDGTAYISDFDLFDAIVMVEYRGLGERYPIRFVGDYVKNLGAEVGEDEGFSLDLYIGRSSEKKDARFRYGYSEAETDAVLAAFSNDNITIPTNYKQHTLTIDYCIYSNMTLNLTWYLYKNKLATDPDNNDYISRLRLNAVVKF